MVSVCSSESSDVRCVSHSPDGDDLVLFKPQLSVLHHRHHYGNCNYCIVVNSDNLGWLPVKKFSGIRYYASAQRSGFVLFVHACVRTCVHPETLLTRYLAQYLAHFLQTYIIDALWDR